MKKILLAVLAVTLAVSCFAMVWTANASADVAVSDTPSGRGYFKVDDPLVDLDFETYSLGEISNPNVTGWYIAASQSEIVSDANGKALKLTNSCNAWATDILSTQTWFSAYRDAGRYSVEFSVKPEKATMITCSIRYAWGNTDLLADFRYNVQYDSNGVATGVTKEVGGWTGSDQKYFNEKIEVVNGFINAYFEFDIAEDVAWGDNAPNVTFQGANVESESSSYIFDNIKIEKLNNSQYFNINWNVDYGALTNVWSEQPIWANEGSVEADYFETGVSALKIVASNTSNKQIGGMNNAEGAAIKVSKNPVLTFFQFDVDLDGITMLNIWTNGSAGLWTEVCYNNGNWSTNNSLARNLSAVKLAKGWRVSYYIDMSASTNANIDFNINTTGDGAVYIANFIVAQIDNVRAPWVSNETVTYNTSEPCDVNVNLDVKGREIAAVTCGGEAVDAANYSYAGETLTLKAAAFNGKTGDLTCAVTTEGGSVDFVVKQEQTQAPVTASLVSSDPINKYVDGTTDVKQAIELTLEGVAEGHDVKLAYTAVYDSAEAGEGRKILISLSLTGADAYLYKLANDTLEITGCEIYDYITVTLSFDKEPVVKYEDGTASVVRGGVVLTLVGVDDGDEVSVAFDAEYDSVLAGDRKINITNAVLTGKDAYKYTLASATLQIDGKIIARTVTTAYYDGVIEKRFDGTTYLNTDGIDLALSNIADGDRVSVTFRAHFSNVDVGESTVKITDIVLTGKDAYKYKLSAETLDVEGYILEVKDVAVSDNKGYYTMDGQTLQKYDFENVATGNIAANTINGLYIAPAIGEIDSGVNQTASVIDDNGNKVLKIEENCFRWSTQLFSTNATGGYREQGIYAVSFKVKPLNAGIIGVLVRNGYSANDDANILADYRYTVTNDGTGKAVSTAKETQGFLGAQQKYFNGYANVGADGWINCYFEYELPNGYINYDNDFCPVVIFTGASATNKAISTYYFDEVAYICKSTSDKYMTIDHNYDMEGVNGAAATNTPFYSDLGDGFVYDSEWTSEFVQNNTVIRLDIPANTSVQNVGALKNSASDNALKLFKGTGLHYVQFDFDMTCSTFKLYSHGEVGNFNFFAISCRTEGDNYVFELECYDGWITNFKTEKALNGMTRVSFLVNMTGSAYDATYMHLEASAGSAGGAVFFDNLFVSHEDYTPVATDTKYNFIGTQDVVFNVDLKGARLLGLELDGEAVTTDKFVYDALAGTITLDKSLFANDNLQTAARRLAVKTSTGDILATASIVDNRPQVTLTLDYAGEDISKDYDGTTDVDQSVIDAIAAQIKINGVTEGDDVYLAYDIAYSSKNAGGVAIVITNIRICGDDAGKYSLATTTLSVNATINKIQLTVSGTTVSNKEYDGTTNANATAGTLNGVLTGEKVTLSVSSAVFNSKNVTEANKVTVTYALAGDDAGNYLVPVSHEVTNVTISKKTVTVTADAKSITVGDSEPELTYTVIGLITGETLTGALTRDEGAEAGEYNILLGTLSGGDNYQINFISAKLTIEQAASEPSKGLTTGAIIGIVVGSAAVAGAAAFAVVFIIKKRRSI